jgi:hypothetical protein
MGKFIICPPIKDDLDYYRFDDEIIGNILRGESMLIAGLRRSGKTSFLYRLQRAAGAGCLLFDVRDFYFEGDPAELVGRAAQRIKSSPGTLVLLDEVEVFAGAELELLEQFIKACRDCTIAMTCAPSFVLELSAYPEAIRNLIEGYPRHLLGPLTREEAEALLLQSKRKKEPAVSKSVLKRILRGGDRLPIVLQALGGKYADGKDISVTLAGVGNSILQGLTDAASETLVQAAHGRTVSTDSREVKLLVALGALRLSRGGQEVSVAGDTLTDLIRESSRPPVNGLASGGVTAAPAVNWERYARILHLSDLHFGPHCIESNGHAVGNQLTRLIDVLEQDEIVPDYITVTGDLSWSGHRSELKAAEDFLEGLVRWFAKARKLKDRFARQRILLIPGNHEAAWALTNGLKEDEVDDWACFSLAPFANLVNRFYRGDAYWDMENPCHCRCFGEPSVAFISISTAHFITQKEKAGKIGSVIQEEIVNLLEQKGVKGARFRIGLMHHNIRPFHDDGRVIRDSEAALLRIARCKPGLDLFLHGHVHQGEVDVYKPRKGMNDVPYSAVGSFGVRAEHRPGDEIRGRIHNEFAVVDLEIDGTGRRFVTQFYELISTTTSNWEWKATSKSDPMIL